MECSKTSFCDVHTNRRRLISIWYFTKLRPDLCRRARTGQSDSRLPNCCLSIIVILYLVGEIKILFICNGTHAVQRRLQLQDCQRHRPCGERQQPVGRAARGRFLQGELLQTGSREYRQSELEKQARPPFSRIGSGARIISGTVNLTINRRDKQRRSARGHQE